MTRPRTAAAGLVDGRLDIERELLAAVCTGGASTLLTLRRAPWSPSWLSGPRRLAAEAAEYLAMRGEAIDADAIAAEVRRCGGGDEEAAEAREVVADAVEAFGGDVAPIAIERLAQALADLAAAEDRPAELLPALRPAAQLLDTTFPPVEHAIDPHFPRGEVAEVVGAHGLYKSTAVLGACLSVASGRSWGGAIVTQGGAVFITMEDSERTLARRVKAWLDGVPAGRERDDAAADIRANFSYLAREHARDLALTATNRLSTTIRAHVVEHLSGVLRGASLVVLETTSRLHDGPEMNEALAVFALAVEDIAIATGAALCIVRHVSKQAARDGTADSYAGRGGGALSDACRSVLVMTRDRKQSEEEDPDPLAPVRLVHAKATHTAKAKPVVWKPVVTEYGVYLYPLTRAEEVRGDARRLLDYLRDLGDEGVTRTDLHKRPPAGLGRSAAKAALEHLASTGQLVTAEEKRGRSKQTVTVYRLASEPSP